MEFQKQRLIKDKSQALLEFVVVFVIMALLLLGLLSIWLWSTGNIVRRQRAYNEQRTAAGSSSPGSPQVPYSVPALRDQDVFYLR